MLLMVFLVYTPGVNSFFHMQGMTGLQWARVAVCMAVVYAVVEIEKALVDPVLMPVIRPVLTFLENITPKWLTVDRPLKERLSLAHLCGNPRAVSKRHSMQRRGVRRSEKSMTAAAAVGGGQGGDVAMSPAAMVARVETTPVA